jgi:hypothetical protein
MQNGMSYPWLMRFSLSAAIALPPTTVLWLAIPASATETPLSSPESPSIAADVDLENALTPSTLPALAAPEPVPTTAQFATLHGTSAPAAQHVHQAHQAFIAAPEAGTTAREVPEAVLTTASLEPETRPASVNPVLPQVEIPNFNVQFSQADLDSPEATEPLESPAATDEANTEAPILDDLEADDTADPALPESVIEETAPEPPALEALEAPSEVTPEAPEPPIEEAAPAAPMPDDTGEELNEPAGSTEETDGEEVFSPLPDSAATDEEEAANDDDASEAPEASEPTEDLPTNGSAAPGVIPADRVVDSLEYLDPDPNPLLIQTTPEEVEIIGTQPLTLEEAIELAYRNNPDLRVALLELEQSQTALREAQAALYPTVSVNGNLQGQNTTDASTEVVTTPGGGLAFETNQTEELGVALSAQLDVVYNIYSSGRRGASIRAAEEQVQLTELEVERRREELRLATANEYYDLQAAIEAIRISQAFLEEAERNLRDTTLREEVGVGTRFDVLRAEVQVANARQDLVNSQRGSPGRATESGPSPQCAALSHHYDRTGRHCWNVAVGSRRKYRPGVSKSR